MMVLELTDLFKGMNIAGYYSDFKKLGATDPEQIREIQKVKLRMLIKHAYERVPWYGRVFKEAGITPADIAVMEDLSQLPVLTREDIRNHLPELLWRNYRGKIFKGSSSGTTGIPIRYFQDENGASAGVAAGYLLWELSGWKPGMRNVHLWGNSESVKQWQKPTSRFNQWLNSRKNIDSTLVNDPERITEVIDKIIAFKPFAIDGYANSIYEIAGYLQNKGIRFPSVKTVFTTAENLELPQQRIIEDSIAPVSDLYGCGEINGIACRPTGDDKYYIYEPHVIVETLPGEKTEMKEILVTDLDNYYMPFIRYQVGDLIDQIEPAISSHAHPFRYFTKVYGRTADHVVLPDGKKLFPVTIFGGTLYRKYDFITRHKTIWDGKKLNFIFETKDSVALDYLERDIRLSLAQYKVQFEINTTNKILPDKSGKYRYFEIK